MKVLYATIFALFAGAAGATQPSWLLGTWCGNLDTMLIDSSGLSFNDQAACQWAEPPTPAPNYTTMLSCLNMRVQSGERIALDPWQGMIDFMRITDDEMEAYFEGDPKPVIYTRCKG